VRGTVYREIDRAASAAEFVIVGRSGWSARRLGSVAHSLFEAGTASLLLVAEGGVHGPLAVIYDGTPASDRALALASALDGSDGRPITVVATGEQAAEQLQRLEVPVRSESVSGNLEVLLERLKRSGARTLLIPVSVFAKAAGRSVILERRNMSVFLIR
jgi:nucleotide-binding universal stress UspA family protein